MKTRALVLTAAYPGPTEPHRAIFLENLHRVIGAESGDEVEFTVVAPRVHRDDPARETRHGVRVVRFGYPSGGRRLKEHDKLPWASLVVYLLSAWWCVLWEARRGDYSMIVCHWILPCGVVGRLAQLVLEVPVVLWAHGTDVRRFIGRSQPVTALADWVVQGAAAVFAVNEELLSTIRTQLCVPESRLHVLAMGVADDFTSSGAVSQSHEDARKRIGLDDRCHLLYVGDLSEEKGVRELLDALRHLNEDTVGFELHAAGSGRLEKEVDTTVGAHRLGDVTPSELAVWYRAADLFVFASRSEGTPVVLMEALASGLPIVATRVGGVPEIVEDGVSGVLVPVHDSSALAAAIEELASDDARRDRMRQTIAASGADHSARARARVLAPFLQRVAAAE